MKKLTAARIIAIILAVVAVISCILCITALTFKNGIKAAEARNSVVYVFEYAEDTQGNYLAGSGTGWAIGTPGQPVQYIVTNGHVVQEAYSYPKLDSSISGRISVVFSAAENDVVTPEVIYFSPPEAMDIAILKLPTPTDKREAMVFRDSDDVQLGDQIYVIGYPGLSDNAATYQPKDVNDVTVTSGVISKRDVPVSGAEWKGFQTDASINHGNSGGPMVDEKGRVIGMNTAGLGAKDAASGQEFEIGVNYAIQINQVARVLREEGISYTRDSDKDVLLYVFAPLGILSLAGAVVLFVLGGKKTADKAGAGQAPAGKNGGKPVLRGVTGQYAGKSFDLVAMRITMGRDPAQCNLIFDKDVPGVSGNHCQIAYDVAQDLFILTDNGSSYGTFLGNGTKLGPAVPTYLKAGDTFYLADAQNRFVVDKE